MTTHAESAPFQPAPTHDHDHHENDDDKNAKKEDGQKHGKSKAILFVAIGLVLIAAIIVGVLIAVHKHRATKEREAREHELAKGPRLSIVKVEMSRALREVSLPGEVRGFNQTTLYGKVSGYVREMRVERGDHVTEGQILAVIESPEIQDDVRSAESNQLYAKRTSDRLDYLSKPGVVTMLERDNAVNAKQRANADLSRARSMLDYTLVKAPFDGVVTARYVDPGALVPAAPAGTQSAQPVGDVSEIDRVRVFVYLGQDAATFAKAGDDVVIYEEERPTQHVPGKITRVAGALDPRTRTMQCEIVLDNRQYHLIPGTFVHVRLKVDIPPSPMIPNEALVTRDGTPHVAVVEDDKVHYRPVEVGTNDGKTTRIEDGLKGGETIGINVPVQIGENETIQPVQPTTKRGAGAEKGSAAGSPTSTPTSTAKPPPPGPVPGASASQPNLGADNGARDAGK